LKLKENTIREHSEFLMNFIAVGFIFDQLINHLNYVKSASLIIQSNAQKELSVFRSGTYDSIIN